MTDGVDIWDHPAIAGKHLIRNWRDHADGKSISVATCQCGWESRTPQSDWTARDRAVEEHWQSVIDAEAVGR